MIIDQIAVALGFEFEDKDKLDSFNRQIKETGKDLAKLGAVAVGFASGIGVLVHKISQMNAELGRSARVLGVSASELSAYKDAVNTVMGGSNEIVGALKNIQAAAVSAWVSGGEVAAAYAHLGVKTHTMTGQLRDSMDILMDVADALQGLPRQQQLWRLQQLGLTEYIALFDKGKAGIQAMIREQDKWKITDAQVKSSQQFEATFARFGTVIRWLTNIFVEYLQPALEDIMKAFIELVDQNREWLKTNIKDIAIAVGQVLKSMAFIVKALAVAFAFLVEVVGGGNLVWAATISFVALVAMKFAYLIYLLVKVVNMFRTATAVLGSPWKTISRAVVIAGQYISNFFSSIAGWIARIGPMLARIGSLFASMWGWIARIGAGIMAWAGGVTAGALLALQAAIAAVVGAWYLFYDSLKEFMGLSTGSVIGNLRKQFEGLAKVFDFLAAVPLAIYTTMKMIFGLFTGDGQSAIQTWKDEMVVILESLAAPFLYIWDMLKKFKDWFLDFFGSDTVRKSVTIAQKLESDGVTDPNFAAGVAGASGESVSTERKYSYDNANSVKKHEYGGSVDFNVNITGDAKNLDKRELQANIQGYLSEKQTEAMRALNSQRRQ